MTYSFHSEETNFLSSSSFLSRHQKRTWRSQQENVYHRPSRAALGLLTACALRDAQPGRMHRIHSYVGHWGQNWFHMRTCTHTNTHTPHCASGLQTRTITPWCQGNRERKTIICSCLNLFTRENAFRWPIQKVLTLFQVASVHEISQFSTFLKNMSY